MRPVSARKGTKVVKTATPAPAGLPDTAVLAAPRALGSAPLHEPVYEEEETAKGSTAGGDEVSNGAHDDSPAGSLTGGSTGGDARGRGGQPAGGGCGSSGGGSCTPVSRSVPLLLPKLIRKRTWGPMDVIHPVAQEAVDCFREAVEPHVFVDRVCLPPRLVRSRRRQPSPLSDKRSLQWLEQTTPLAINREEDPSVNYSTMTSLLAAAGLTVTPSNVAAMKAAVDKEVANGGLIVRQEITSYVPPRNYVHVVVSRSSPAPQCNKCDFRSASKTEHVATTAFRQLISVIDTCHPQAWSFDCIVSLLLQFAPFMSPALVRTIAERFMSGFPSGWRRCKLDTMHRLSSGRGACCMSGALFVTCHPLHKDIILRTQEFSSLGA